MSLQTAIRSRLSHLSWQDWLFAAAGANFALCGLIAAGVGGEAITGHSTSGHYFLNNHGRFTEVDHVTFLILQIHTVLALGLLAIASLFRGLSRKRQQDEDKALARRVRSRYRWQS